MLSHDVLPRAWETDTYRKLGGVAIMAGVDLDLVLLSRSILDHPWMNQEVTFPFPEVGTGKISHCIIHPQGALMFDVEFPEPVPYVRGWWSQGPEPGGCEIMPSYLTQSQRFYGKELLGIINGDWTPYTTINGRRVPLNNKETKQ